MIGEILSEARKMMSRPEEISDVTIRVHPDVAKVLKSRGNNYLQDLEETFKANVLVRGDSGQNPESFNFH